MAKGSKVTIQKMPLNKIKLSRNSRLNIDPEELSGLMQSIKEEGLLQPIGVIKNGVGYEICYGNRRFLACSKLGMASIPVIVHEKKKDSDADMKNLTENIQRRNVSLAEVGRYIELLKEQGITPAESAVRLGVEKGYISACLSAFNEIPKEFQKDIEVRVVHGKSKNNRTAPGKIAVRVAQRIVTAQKNGKITGEQQIQLLTAARSDERFRNEKVDNYIDAIQSGAKNFLVGDHLNKKIQPVFYITEKHYQDLFAKHVTDGPYGSISGLVRAVLRGEKSVKINVL